MSPTEAVVMIALFASGAVTVSSIARAYMRRLDVRDRTNASTMTGDSVARLARIEQAIESIAIEVERVSEGQRFTTRLLAERSPATGRERADMYRGSE
jgi:hypothetical protein